MINPDKSVCASPADFDPFRWNTGQQRVLHLNQKLQDGGGRQLINKTRADVTVD